jgi:hypothetical protein
MCQAGAARPDLQSRNPSAKQRRQNRAAWRATAAAVQKAVVGARHQWLTPVILATQEAEIRKITL